MNHELPSFFELVADKLAAHPELIRVARENCARWLDAKHTAPDRLRQWDALLHAAERDEDGRARLLDALLGEDPEQVRLRDFHPFAGILTREERRQARELCGYRH
jgi:hypothetical protein